MSDETTPAPDAAPDGAPDAAAEKKPAADATPPAEQPGDSVPTPAPAPAPAVVHAAAAAAGHNPSAEASAKADDGHGHAHGLPFNPWIIFVALLILTGLSWGADAFLGGNFSILTISVIVMAISTCKATLVIAFFMHYRYESKWKYVLTIPPMIVGVLIMLALIPDVGYRASGTQRPSATSAAAGALRAPWSDPVTGGDAAHKVEDRGAKAGGRDTKAGAHGEKSGEHGANKGDH